jgi:hypothetical protein
MGYKQKLANSAVTLNCNLTVNAQQWKVLLGHELLFRLLARITGCYVPPLDVWTFHCASGSCKVVVLVVQKGETSVPKSGARPHFTTLRSAVNIMVKLRRDEGETLKVLNTQGTKIWPGFNCLIFQDFLKGGKLLTSWATVVFSRRTPLHGVSWIVKYLVNISDLGVIPSKILRLFYNWLYLSWKWYVTSNQSSQTSGDIPHPYM